MADLDTIKVRRITPREFEALTPDIPVYVQDTTFQERVLVEAHIADRLTPFYNDTAEIQTVYGVSAHYSARDVFLPDEHGEPQPLMRTAGRKATVTLFLPGMGEDEINARVRKALRDEFGPGSVELWKLRTQPTRDVRWDVYFERRELGGDGTWHAAETRLEASGVRDGHQNLFMGKEPLGWKIRFAVHTPAAREHAEVL